MTTVTTPRAERNRASTPTTAPSGRVPTNGLTGWAKTCAVYANCGKTACADPEHHNRVPVTQRHIDELLCANGARINDRRPVRKPNAEIISLMVPLQRAKCECERSACKEAWNHKRPGVFQSEYVQAPNYFKGVGSWDKGSTPRRVMPVSFRLKSKELEFLHERFPNWYFAVDGLGGHDHPISHVTTQVVAWELKHGLKRGKSYLDMHGNPTSNEAYTPEGVTLDTYVSLASDKDWYRKNTSWGPEVQGARRRYTVGPILSNLWDHTEESRIAEGRDGFISVHTGYYYKFAEVLALLSKSPNATLTMVMHRFDGHDGSHNQGELKWVKKDEGAYKRIVQTNVAGKEVYSHPDNAHWFTQHSWCSVTQEAATTQDARYEAPRALTWSIGLAADDVWKVIVTTMPAYAFYQGAAPVNPAPEEDPILAYGGVSLEVGEEDKFVKIPGAFAPLFDELRKKMNHQPRTQQKFKAHVQTCNQKQQEWTARTGIPVNSKQLSHLQTATFWVDFARDAAVDTELAIDNQWAVESYAAVLNGSSFKLDGNKIDALMGLVHNALSASSRVNAALAVVTTVRAQRSNM